MLPTLILGCALAVSAPNTEPATLAIRAEKVLLDDGRVLDGGIVLVRDGRIVAVGTDVDVPADASRIDHKGWMSAGLVAMNVTSGATGEVSDSTRPALPEGRVAWAYDPAHPEFADLAREGITSVVLTPARRGLIGGVSAVVKSAGDRIVAREAQLSLGFSDDHFAPNRFPTSTVGAVAELERLFEKPTGMIERASRGDLRVQLEVSSRADVERALEFAQRHKLVGSLSGAGLAGELAPDIKRSGLAVVCAPLGIGADLRELRSVVALANAEVPFSFTLEAPWRNPANLRVGAALCMRQGLGRAQAWRALTTEPARIAGVQEHVGKLEEGLDADIVLWSGDPLSLGSGIVGVFVDGKRVHTAEQR